MRSETVTYRRAELYDQVWAEPVRTVAARFGISDVALAKICKKLDVPLPGRGYWAKKHAKQKVRRVPLPKKKAGVPDEFQSHRWLADESSEPSLPEDVAAQIEREKSAEARIVVPDQLVAPHKLVRDARAALRATKPNHELRLEVRGERCLDIAVSAKSLTRALRIFDTLIKECSKRGFEVEVTDVNRQTRYDDANPSNVTRVRVDEEWIPLRLVEKWSIQVADAPVPPRQLRGEERERWISWNRPRRSLIPNGTLELSFGRTTYSDQHWADGKSRKLEHRLNDVIVAMILRSQSLKRGREVERLRQKKADEEYRRRLEEQRHQEEEQRRAEALRTRVADWRFAQDVRECVAAALATISDAKLQVTTDGPLDSEFKWALKYADSIDPVALLAREIAEFVAQNPRTTDATQPERQ